MTTRTNETRKRRRDAARRGEKVVVIDEHTRRVIDMLVATRKLRGMTQRDVLVGMGNSRNSQSMISELESGVVEPRLGTLMDYAAAIGVRLRIEIDLVDLARRYPHVLAMRERLEIGGLSETVDRIAGRSTPRVRVDTPYGSHGPYGEGH